MASERRYRTSQTDSTAIKYSVSDVFYCLAILLLHSAKSRSREIFGIPRDVADKRSNAYTLTKKGARRQCRVDTIPVKFAEFRDNLKLEKNGAAVEVIGKRK